MALLHALLASSCAITVTGIQSAKPHKVSVDTHLAHRSRQFHETMEGVQTKAGQDHPQPVLAEVSSEETDSLSIFQMAHMVVPNVSSARTGHRGAWIQSSGIFGIIADRFHRLMTPPNVTDQGTKGYEDDADGDHIFGRRRNEVVTDQDSLFSVPKSEYVILGTTVIALLLFELFVLQPLQDGSLRHSMHMMFFWILVAVCYNVYFGVRYGTAEGCDWMTGYLLEWLLSMDNLFVFHLIFKAYSTPKKLLDKALFWGISGAVFFRMLFFICIGELIHLVHWFRYIFGAVLVYSGIATALEGDDEEEESDAETDRRSYWSTRILQTILGPRMLEQYDTMDGRFFIAQKGVVCATLLLPVVLCLEVTDVVFAVDSVTAKVAQIPNQYVAYSSSVFAMFGLRYMFFVIKELVDMFELLKYGICVILCFIGIQLILADYVQVSSATVFLFISSVFFVCIVGSPLFKRCVFGQLPKDLSDSQEEDVVGKSDRSITKKRSAESAPEGEKD